MLLHIGDSFDRITAVMRICFGRDYRACYRGSYSVNSDRSVCAWFPKLSGTENGLPKPADKRFGWCNTLSGDGRLLYMDNPENPALLNKLPEPEPVLHITFARFPGEGKYRYIGVFVRTKRDPERGWVYERRAGDIDLREYTE